MDKDIEAKLQEISSKVDTYLDMYDDLNIRIHNIEQLLIEINKTDLTVKTQTILANSYRGSAHCSSDSSTGAVGHCY